MAYVDLWVGIKEGILASYNIAKSKTRPQGDASHTLWSRRASVWNFYNLPNATTFFCTPLIMTLSLFGRLPFIWKYGLSYFFLFFSFSLFFLHALWHAFFSLSCFFSMDIYFLFFFFFSIAHTYFWHMKTFLERDSWKIWMEYLFGGRKNMFLRNS